jgi:hypothetical protein
MFDAIGDVTLTCLVGVKVALAARTIGNGRASGENTAVPYRDMGGYKFLIATAATAAEIEITARTAATIIHAVCPLFVVLDVGNNPQPHRYG